MGRSKELLLMSSDFHNVGDLGSITVTSNPFGEGGFGELGFGGDDITIEINASTLWTDVDEP